MRDAADVTSRSQGLAALGTCPTQASLVPTHSGTSELLGPTRGLRTGQGASLLRGARQVALAALVLTGIGICSGPAHARDSDIRLSSIGYVADRSKVASVISAGTTFSVKRAADGVEVFSGNLTKADQDLDTQQYIQQADFTSVKDAGEYYLEVPGVGRSFTFRIDPDAYKRSFTLAMLGFYAWRANTDVSLSVDGITWAHKKSPVVDALLDKLALPATKVGDTRDGTGGWYDAGDYGKYVVNAGITVGTMLQAWEDFPALKEVVLPIPEKADAKFPDFLDEIKWETDWLLKMQYSATDGRVSHKVTSLNHDGFVLPEKTAAARYFVPYSSAATADFVAILAKASRAFKPYDAAYAKTLLDAAKVSYAWLKANPENHDADQTGFATGTYKTTDVDDRMWAAAELFEATQEASYLTDFEQTKGVNYAAWSFDWADVGTLGTVTYLRSTAATRDPAVVAQATKILVNAADNIVSNGQRGGYGRAATAGWGSNGTTARTCVILQAANRLSPKAAYLDSCNDQIAHLYGRNYFGRSQVTQEGKDPPMNPHDRRSGGDTIVAPYPGYLVGGPETSLTIWNDSQSDFRTNEIAINWNAALVYALAGFVKAGEWDGKGGAPFCTAQDAPQGKGDFTGPASMLDDLEDGDLKILSADGRTGNWMSFIEPNAAAPTLEVIAANRDKSTKTVHVSSGPTTSWGGGVGIIPAVEGTTFNACSYTGITFWAKGTLCGQTIQLKIADSSSYEKAVPKACINCSDHFSTNIRLDDKWAQYTVTWDAFAKAGWGDPKTTSVDLAKIYQILFQWGTSASAEFWVDDVAFTTAKGGPADQCKGTAPAGTGGAAATAVAPGAGGRAATAVGAGGTSAGTGPVSGVPVGGTANGTASAAGTTATSDSGCGCRAAGSSDSKPWALVAALGASLAFLRRRKSLAAKS